MSRNLGPLLNPGSPKAMAITLGRRAFLHEMVMAALLSLTLPITSLVGVYLYFHSSDVNLIGLMVGVVTVSAVTAIPLICYASLRLNAATLARERVYSDEPERLIHKPFEGPFLLRRSIVAGSVKSRILAMFPGCLGFGLEFALMSYLTGASAFLFLHVPIGGALVIQAFIVANLLR